MDEQTHVPPENPTGQTRPPVEESWREVGERFKVLGESLAQALRSSWENEETQRVVKEMKTGLESMAKEVGKAVDEFSSSPQGQRFRQEAEQAGESFRYAADQTVQEVRPHLIRALTEVNNEQQKLIQRMEEKRPGGPEQTPDE